MCRIIFLTLKSKLLFQSCGTLDIGGRIPIRRIGERGIEETEGDLCVGGFCEEGREGEEAD